MALDCKRPKIAAALCWSVVLLTAIASAAGLALLAPIMAPVREGSSHVFWKFATGVSLSPEVKDRWGGDTYFVDDTWAAYDSQHLHGSDIYRVPVTDVSVDFKAVVAELEQAVQNGKDTPVLKGYMKWRDDADQPRDAVTLLKNIKEARNLAVIERVIERDIDQFAFMVAQEQQFWQRWQRADTYWASIAFEWTLLTGLALFTLWPVICGYSAGRTAIQIALVPVLFMLPIYLGYAAYTFTSAGPRGGVLYPFLAIFWRGGSVNPFDSWILKHLPPILEPLSAPIGSPLALTGMGMPGPTNAVLAGICLGVVVFALMTGYRQWAQRRAHAPSGAAEA